MARPEPLGAARRLHGDERLESRLGMTEVGEGSIESGPRLV